jgi:hypothetical protein
MSGMLSIGVAKEKNCVPVVVLSSKDTPDLTSGVVSFLLDQTRNTFVRYFHAPEDPFSRLCLYPSLFQPFLLVSRVDLQKGVKFLSRRIRIVMLPQPKYCLQSTEK